MSAVAVKLPVIGDLPDAGHRGLPGVGDQRVLVTDLDGPRPLSSPGGRGRPGDAAPGRTLLLGCAGSFAVSPVAARGERPAVVAGLVSR